MEVKRRKSRCNNGRNCEERDGGDDEHRRIQRWGRGRFVLTLGVKEETGEVHFSASLRGLLTIRRRWGRVSARSSAISVAGDPRSGWSQNLARSEIQIMFIVNREKQC